MTLTETGKRAKETAGVLGILGSDKKNEGLRAAAAALLEGEEDILTANQDDVIQATINGMSAGMIDRLELTPSRIEAMADGLISVARLDDPVGGDLHEGPAKRTHHRTETRSHGRDRHHL